MDVLLEGLLREAGRRGASDLHLTADFPAMFRIDGALEAATDRAVPAEMVRSWVESALTEGQRDRLLASRELDLALALPNVGRFRVNCHWQRGNLEAAFRRVNDQIPPLRDLGLPPAVERLCDLRSGLVLVTGAAGMGKSTTLASMVNHINRTKQRVIITVEDPIEYTHANASSIVKQREVGSDTLTFGEALRHALRQDPDVILVGEMRDLETISCAITAAETGHLVMSTLHTPDTAQSIDRLIDVFPAERQRMVMTQLASCLQAVVSQLLLPKARGGGRALACEVLLANTGVRSCIRDHQTHQIMSQIQIGSKDGMVAMDQSLAELVRSGAISRDTAVARMRDPKRV